MEDFGDRAVFEGVTTVTTGQAFGVFGKKMKLSLRRGGGDYFGATAQSAGHDVAEVSEVEHAGVIALGKESGDVALALD